MVTFTKVNLMIGSALIIGVAVGTVTGIAYGRSAPSSPMIAAAEERIGQQLATCLARGTDRSLGKLQGKSEFELALDQTDHQIACSKQAAGLMQDLHLGLLSSGK